VRSIWVFLEWLPFQRYASQFHVLNFFSWRSWDLGNSFHVHRDSGVYPNIITSNPHFHLVLIASNPYVEYRTPHDIFPVDCIEMFYYHSATLVQLPQNTAQGIVDTFQRSITNDEIKHFVQRWCYRSLDIRTKHFFDRNNISGCEMPSFDWLCQKAVPCPWREFETNM